MSLVPVARDYGRYLSSKKHPGPLEACEKIYDELEDLTKQGLTSHIIAIDHNSKQYKSFYTIKGPADFALMLRQIVYDIAKNEYIKDSCFDTSSRNRVLKFIYDEVAYGVEAATQEYVAWSKGADAIRKSDFINRQPISGEYYKKMARKMPKNKVVKKKSLKKIEPKS